MNTEVRSIGRLLTAPHIVDLGTKYGLTGWFGDFLATRRALKRTRQLFPQYSFAGLHQATIINYHQLRKGHAIGDHVAMMRFMSPELYNQWKRDSTPFQFSSQLLNFRLKRARTIEVPEGSWSQIWVELAHQWDKGHTTGIYILERKVNPLEHWRFRRFPFQL